MQKEAAGDLTKILEGIQINIEGIQDEIDDVVHNIESNKETLVTQILSELQPGPMEQDKEIFIREQLTEEIDEIIDEIKKTRAYLERFGVVLRGSSDISRRLEKSWWEKLMTVIKDTKWYRENFPAQYEEERRRREYEQYRLHPDVLYKSRETPDEKVRIKGTFKLKRKASNNVTDIIQRLQNIHSQILHIYQQFFSVDSPILGQANVLLKKLRNMGARETDKTSKLGLSDQARIVENLFGIDTQPGRLIFSGGSAFLLPSAHAIQRAITKMQQPVSQLDLVPDVGKELEKYFQSWQEQQQEKERKLQQIINQQARKNIVLERLGIKTRQQKRCKLVQRIASS